MNTKRIAVIFLYAYILGLGLAIIFTPISTTFNEGNGVSTTNYKEPMEYIVLVFRIAFITGFIGVVGCVFFKRIK
ncbi:MAG: hypothetical protein ACQET8_16520 [Bacillota bacterium]